MHPETINQYLSHLYPPKRQAFIQASGIGHFDPVVEDDVARTIRLLLRLIRAQRILEIGTSLGFSTVHLAEAVDAWEGRITTIEYDPSVAERALRNFERCGFKSRIELRLGDAAKLVPQISGPFDAIFLDVDKRLYAPLLEDCIRLLRPGGLLMAEDTLFPVMDLEPRWQPLVAPIETFNNLLAGDQRMESLILPIGDGLTLAWKR